MKVHVIMSITTKFTPDLGSEAAPGNSLVMIKELLSA